jgi:hypothetical protein
MLRSSFALLALIPLAACPGAALGSPNYTAVILPLPAGYSDASAYGISGNQAVGVAYVAGGAHAMLWNIGGSTVDLGEGAVANAVVNGAQFGAVSYPDTTSHAFMWFGNPAGGVDLHPAGHTRSGVITAAPGIQGGVADSDAVYWTGSAASMVDLHPAGAQYSKVQGVVAGEQVGFGDFSGPQPRHALLWHGTPESMIDLGLGWAVGTDGVHQVGATGNVPGMWSGSAASAVSFDRLGYGYGEATGIADDYISGWASTGLGTHALLWSGPSHSALDLHPFLPQTYGNSRAFGVDASGNVIGEASNFSGSVAVIWMVPEPALAGLLLPLALMRRLRRK